MLNGQRATRGALREHHSPSTLAWKKRRREHWIRQVDGISPQAAEVLYLLQGLFCRGKVRVLVLQRPGLTCYYSLESWCKSGKLVTAPGQGIKYLRHQWENLLGVEALRVHWTDLPFLVLLQWNFITDLVSHHTYYIIDWRGSIYGCPLLPPLRRPLLISFKDDVPEVGFFSQW